MKLVTWKYQSFTIRILSDKFFNIDLLKMEKNKKKRKKVKVIKVTSTYYQGAVDTFELHSIDVDPRKEATEKIEENKANPDDILEVGFSDGASKNQKYRNLIIRSGLQLIDNQQILQIYDKWLFGDQPRIQTIEKNKF